MLKRFKILFFSIVVLSYIEHLSAEITVNELVLNTEKPFHIKILEALPKQAKIVYGPVDAKNTIIEFMDYLCGYCKKIHPELLKIVDERNDVRVFFIQHPILSENSKVLSRYVLAANLQNKGFDLHDSILSISGGITQKKIEKSMDKIGINKVQLNIDIGRPDINNMIQLSTFLANGAGARGTPTLFINEEFIGGFIQKQQIISLLK